MRLLTRQCCGTLLFVIIVTVIAADACAVDGSTSSCDTSGCDVLADDGCDCGTCVNGGGYFHSIQRASDRWTCLSRNLEEECGIKFEGAVTQFYQGVASGGLQRKFRYGGHGDYDFDLDMGKICGLDGFTVELGSEHRFADTVNQSTGSVVPVALLPNLP